MSGFSLPRFAKTGGKTQRFDSHAADSPDARSPSLLQTLKAKLKRGGQSMGSRSFDDGDSTPGLGSTGKTGGGSARSVSAFAWAGHSSTLQQCAAEGDLDGVTRLLNLGEDANGVDEAGNTALHSAVEAGFEEVAALLLARGADPNAANEDGDTALHKATINNYIRILALLVAGGADVNAQSHTGWTALHEAACNGRLEATKSLLHVGADVNQRTRGGDTALHKAARWGRTEIVRLLLLVGADPWIRDKSGREALQRTNIDEIVQLLKAQKLETRPGSGAGSPRRPSAHSRPRQGGAQAQQQPQRAAAAASEDEWEVADARELYEVQWSLFASNKDPQRRVGFGDVPWPGDAAQPGRLLEVVLYGCTTAEERKRRLRAELLRWHPDKFQALCGRHMRAEDAERILARVKEISQAINMASK